MGDVYVDGKWVKAEKAVLPAFHTGLLYGESVFEAIPFYAGRPLFWDDHVRRMKRGCDFLGWAAPSQALLKKVASRAWARWDGGNRGILRINWVCPLGPQDAPSHPSPDRPILLAAFRPLRHNPLDPNPQTLNVGVSAWRVPDTACYPFGFKTAFYLTVRREMRTHRSWQEMLRLDTKGHVVEGAFSSPLLLAGREIWAPPAGAGGLESVTRRRVLESCGRSGWKVLKKAWKPRDVFAPGRELVFVGSGLGVAAVRALSGKSLGSTGSGALKIWGNLQKSIRQAVKG